MLVVKLSVADVRLLKAAQTEPELRGVVDMLVAKTEQAEVMRSFGTSTPRPSGYGWKDAWECAKRHLGDQVTMPPFPDSRWFGDLNKSVRLWGIDDDYVARLCAHAKANMRLPIRFRFMIQQAERVLAGEWDLKRKPQGAPSAPLPLLPED